MKFIAAFAVILATTSHVVAQPKDPATIPPAVVKATFDFSKPSSGPADAFFKKLDSAEGRTIYLTLEIIPKQQADALGYTLTRMRSGAEQSGDKVVCGGESGDRGLVDNYRTSYRLTFQHPEHFHAPTEIIIAPRADKPFHEIRCGAEGAGEQKFSRLQVRGHFVVTVASIPTANSYALFPYAR